MWSSGRPDEDQAWSYWSMEVWMSCWWPWCGRQIFGFELNRLAWLMLDFNSTITSPMLLSNPHTTSTWFVARSQLGNYMLNCMDLTRYCRTMLNRGWTFTSLALLATKHAAFGKESTRIFEKQVRLSMWDQSPQHLLWLNHFISHSSTATSTALEI